MVITISRQFGTGGVEIGKKLAEMLGYDYYDKEIICICIPCVSPAGDAVSFTDRLRLQA